jgi:hypothetical protein
MLVYLVVGCAKRGRMWHVLLPPGVPKYDLAATDFFIVTCMYERERMRDVQWASGWVIVKCEKGKAERKGHLGISIAWLGCWVSVFAYGVWCVEIDDRGREKTRQNTWRVSVDSLR